MSPRPDVSEARKRQILEAAASVFARTGLHEARMEDVAAEAGLSKAAVYLYFEGKDAVITALLSRLFELEIEDLKTLARAAGPAAERLRTLTRRLLLDYEKAGIETAVFREFYALAAREKKVRAFLRDYFREYRELLAELVRQGIERGEFREAEPQGVALAILGVYEGLALLWAIDPRGMSWTEATETAMSLLLAGLQGAPARGRSGARKSAGR